MKTTTSPCGRALRIGTRITMGSHKKATLRTSFTAENRSSAGVSVQR